MTEIVPLSETWTLKKKSLKIKKMFGQFYLFAKPQKFFSLN